MPQNSRLSMLDEFGVRRQIIPAETRGRFRRSRNYVYFVKLFVFLALPWIQINGTQALLLDILNRKFEFFGLVFMSHDSPLIFFLVSMLALSIILTTAVFGRLWCGWACPQTVFIDAVYRKIEYFIEGNYIERRKLYDSPLSSKKFFKYSLKWIAFIAVSSLFAHSFIAYFTGSRHLLEMMSRPPQENWSYFLTVTFVTALVTFNFGWFREQFCIIVCPYGRFQSVLMDSQSINVTYDQNRGEPRRGFTAEGAAKRGDCVSCNRCVQVCPTGIDIRNGLQMECIGCTACIDACDEIMKKVNKPTGLIAYRPGAPVEKVNYLRPRVLVYVFLFGLCTLGLAYNVATHEPFSIAVLRGKDTPYQISPDGTTIINHFKMNLHNQSHLSQSFAVSIPADLETQFKLTQPSNRYDLNPGESKEVHLFVSFSPVQVVNGKTLVALQVHEYASGQTTVYKTVGVGPYSSKTGP